jgi:hypothetical protein
MFAASTILYKMLVCLSESRGGLHLENLFLATVDSAILTKKTASVILKGKKRRVYGKKNGECLQSWPFSAIVD